MTWFKVDDDLPFHRKVVAAGNAAMGLWVRAGAWSSQQLTDGFVPDDMVALMGTPAQRRKLIKVRLWVEVEGGCQFHEWNDPGRQPTSQNVRERRSESAKRQQRYRDKNFESSQVRESRNGVTHASVTEVVTPVLTPPPTRPVVTTKNSLTDADASAAFATWWSNYPRKVDKRAAEKAYRAALRRRGVTPDRLLAAVQAYAAQCADTEPRFIKHAATWLNAGSYDDELPAPTLGSAAHPPSGDPQAALASLRERAGSIRCREAANDAARLLRDVFIPDPPPRGRGVPEHEWVRREAVRYVDEHADALLAALAHRQASA